MGRRSVCSGHGKTGRAHVARIVRGIGSSGWSSLDLSEGEDFTAVNMEHWG